MVVDEEDIFLGATTTVSLTKDSPLVETNTTVTRCNDIFSSALAGSGDQEFVKNVVGIFVVRFDVRQGNIIEWQFPEELDLRGVEFQAMPSGLHTISQDVIYFSRHHYNGIAAFKNLPLFDQSIDRGARMASVGIVVSATSDTGPCGQPWRHLEFLKSEVGKRVKQLGDYSSLMHFYSKWGVPLSDREREDNGGFEEPTRQVIAEEGTRGNSELRNRLNGSDAIALTEPIRSADIKLMNSHPVRVIADFVRRCGPTIFLLWKAVLLGKRILFFTKPPIEEACYAVYCTCLVGHIPSNVNRSLPKHPAKIKPLFNIGVSDIQMLESFEGGYVACTTDRIFQHKTDLYDIMVNFDPTRLPSVSISANSSLPKIVSTRINSTDTRRYRLLLRLLTRDDPLIEDDEGESGLFTLLRMVLCGWIGDERDGYIRLDDSEPENMDTFVVNEDGDRQQIEVDVLRYFNTLNASLFNTLRSTLSLSARENDLVTYLYSNHMNQLRVNPRYDGEFIEEIALLYFDREVDVVGKRRNWLMNLFVRILSFLHRLFERKIFQ